MNQDASFDDLISRVEAGEKEAAAELVRQFEPEIRRYVRVQLKDPGLRRTFDSMDICQSVLGNFFANVDMGDLQLATRQHLVNLLRRMARNKVVDLARQEHAAIRNQGRREPGGDALLNFTAGREPAPSKILATKDEVEKLRQYLSEEEWQLAWQWAALGRTWVDIAKEHSCNADTLRLKLAKAFDRVRQIQSGGNHP